MRGVTLESMIKVNYHTHHHLCNHAEGTAMDYAEEAVDKGLDALGIACHAPSDRLDDGLRMQFHELSDYLDDINQTKSRFKDRLTIYTGLEVEYFDKNPSYYERLLEKVEYLMLGQHFLPNEKPEDALISCFDLKNGKHLIDYAKSIEEALKTGYFSLVSHPDLYMCGYPQYDAYAEKAADIICQASIKYDVPLEFNANGLRRGKIRTKDGIHYPYPRIPFWEHAKKLGCNVILSSDCHSPKYLMDEAVAEAYQMIIDLKLNLIDEISLKR